MDFSDPLVQMLNFKDEEIEVHKIFITCSRSHSNDKGKTKVGSPELLSDTAQSPAFLEKKNVYSCF